MNGLEFGTIESLIKIDLRPTTSSILTACNNPTWQPSTTLYCTVPILATGKYIVLVTVDAQTSSQNILFEVVPAPPPIAHNVVALGIQGTVQKSILIALNATSYLASPNFYIENMPRNGTLFQFSEGAMGTQIQQGGPPLVSSSLFYIPNQYFSGKDHFTYCVNVGTKSNTANVNVSISFTNQAPWFIRDAFVLALNESSTTYSLDLLALIFDPDEYSNCTIQFKSLPKRGNWTFNGNEAFIENPTLLQLGKTNILEVNLDQKGGINPYFKFSASSNDSYGLVSSNSIEISGFITCNSTNALNTWGTGPVCVSCPVGAVFTLIYPDMVF